MVKPTVLDGFWFQLQELPPKVGLYIQCAKIRIKMTAPQLGTGGCSSHSSQPGSIYGHNHLGAVAVILEGLDIITYDMGKMVTNREVPMDLFQVFFWGGEGWNIAFGWLSIMALTCMCWSITSKRFKKWCSFDWCSNLLNTTWKHSGE